MPVQEKAKQVCNQFILIFTEKDNTTATKKEGEEVIGVRRGKCKWFNVLKGFGFIVPDDGTQEVFVHQVSLKYDWR